MKSIEVLLVEDSAGDTMLVLGALENFPTPVKVHLARDGEQALLMLRERIFDPDLVILDLNLPKLSGYQVLERIHLGRVPVIVFAGSSSETNVRRALELGAREFVQKPDELGMYEETVRRMVDQWGRWKQDDLPPALM